MKIKWGSLVTDGRGKIGGHVASKNRGGAYMRTKVSPVNPQTSYQLAVRAILTFLSQAWKALTQAQISAWNNAVASFTGTNVFGDVKQPSGFNLYMRLNSNLQNANFSEIDEPPVAGVAPAPVAFSATPNSGTQAIALVLTDGAVPADTAYIIEATAPLSAGKSFIKNAYRKVVTLAPAAATPHALGPEYVAKFGAFAAGQKIGFRIKAVTDAVGLDSGYTEHVVVVV